MEIPHYIGNASRDQNFAQRNRVFYSESWRQSNVGLPEGVCLLHSRYFWARSQRKSIKKNTHLCFVLIVRIQQFGNNQTYFHYSL
jgi:hypothetical protein